jgi:hypothetical protein
VHAGQQVQDTLPVTSRVDAVFVLHNDDDPQISRKLIWTDRAWLALLAGLLPRERIAGLRLIVTPATLLRWHREILRRR